jgi:hypothetical protein
MPGRVLAGLCRFTVELAAPAGNPDKWGARQYGTPVRYPAFIEYQVRRVLGFDGREVTSHAQVYLPGDVPVEVTWRITLPSGMKPVSPVIVGIEKPAEPGRVHHTVLHLGGRIVHASD